MMMINEFKEIDLYLVSQNVNMKSVFPLKDKADSFENIGQFLLYNYPTHQKFLELFAQQFRKFIEAQVHHFPENIFWDYSYLCHQVYRKSVFTKNPEKSIEAYISKLIKLLKVFGRESNICFRYMHDFLYGFDWARWVRKAPKKRVAINPFDLQFLEYLCKRAKELELLISENDKKYNQIEKGEFRNPFFFSRAPKDEARLLQSLATDGLIPVSVWEFNCTPNWSKSFSELRAERAVELSIPIS